MGPARGIDDHQLVAADAMFGMNDEIAFLKRADLTQEIVASGARPGTGQALAENIGFGNDQQPVCLEAGVQQPFHDEDAAGLELVEARHARRRAGAKMRLEKFGDAHGSTLAGHGDEHRPVRGLAFGGDDAGDPSITLLPEPLPLQSHARHGHRRHALHVGRRRKGIIRTASVQGPGFGRIQPVCRKGL